MSAKVMPTTTAAWPCAGTLSPTKLFIGGLSRHTTTKHLREHFSQGGTVRVLDCVAMRQADGRPRGFGYVTFDSPAEADRVLAAPQIIDNRVVDVKPAIPDPATGAGMTVPSAACRELQAVAASMSSSPATRQAFGWPDAPDMFYSSPSSPELLHTLPNVEPVFPWADVRLSTPDATEPLDCLDLLSRRRQQVPAKEDGLDCVDLLTRPRLSGPPAALSAGAPEFVPMAAQAAWAQAPSVAASYLTAPAKVPLAERTNIVEEQSVIVMKEQPIKAIEDDATGLSTGPPSALNSEASSPVSASELPSDVLPADVELLPSKGSAGHGDGNCRRCNFFPKGRCQNGYDCTFCHFPHEKQKFTRQEKRERRAVAQAQCAMGEEGNAAGMRLSTECHAEISGSTDKAALDKAAFPILSDMSISDVTMLPSMESGALEFPATFPSLPPGLLPPQQHLASLEVASPHCIPLPAPPHVAMVPSPSHEGHFCSLPTALQNKLLKQPPEERHQVAQACRSVSVSVGTQTDIEPELAKVEAENAMVPQRIKGARRGRKFTRERLLQAREFVDGTMAGVPPLRALRVNK